MRDVTSFPNQTAVIFKIS